jgi:hypothetical protein
MKAPPISINGGVTAALGAPLSVTVSRLVERSDKFGTFCDLDTIPVPQCKCIHRPGRPRPSAFTMAISNSGGRAGNSNFNGTAKAVPDMHIRHSSSPWLPVRFNPSLTGPYQT